jgi:hypothetical protein
MVADAVLAVGVNNAGAAGLTKLASHTEPIATVHGFGAGITIAGSSTVPMGRIVDARQPLAAFIISFTGLPNSTWIRRL